MSYELYCTNEKVLLVQISSFSSEGFVTSSLPARKYDHVTQLLRELHWLRASERITFRLAVFMAVCMV